MCSRCAGGRGQSAPVRTTTTTPSSRRETGGARRATDGGNDAIVAEAQIDAPPTVGTTAPRSTRTSSSRVCSTPVATIGAPDAHVCTAAIGVVEAVDGDLAITAGTEHDRRGGPGVSTAQAADHASLPWFERIHELIN